MYHITCNMLVQNGNVSRQNKFPAGQIWYACLSFLSRNLSPGSLPDNNNQVLLENSYFALLRLKNAMKT